MKRYLNLLDYTLGSLLRRKWKILLLVLLFSYLVFLFSSVLLLTGAIKNEAKKGIRALPDITIQRLAAGRQVPMPIGYGEKLREVFGIERVEPRIWGYYFVASTQANYTLIGYDNERDTWKGLGNIVLQGTADLKLGDGEAVLGQGVLGRARPRRPPGRRSPATRPFARRLRTGEHRSPVGQPIAFCRQPGEPGGRGA